MSDRTSQNSGQSNVRSSRIMDLATVIALGSLATVGLAVFLLAPRLLKHLGVQTPFGYLVAFAFSIPLVLSLAERAAVVKGKGGIFNLSRTSGAVWIQYWTGWLLFGGYLLLGAIYGWALGEVLSDGLLILTGNEIDPRILTVGGVLLLGLLKLPNLRLRLRARTILIYIALLAVFGFIIRLWAIPLQVSPAWAFLSTGESLSAAPVLAVSLWGISFILDHRDEIRHPQRRMLAYLILPLLLGAAIGIITAVVLLQYSGYVATRSFPLLSLAADIGVYAHLILLAAMLIFTVAGLNQVLASEGRLIKRMVESGFISRRVSVKKGHIRPYLNLTLPPIIALIVVFLPPEVIIGATTAMLLMSIALTTGQDVFSRKSNLPEDRRFKLPLHPLIPATAAIISLTLAIAQPVENQLATLFWIFLGAVYYVIYGRQGAVSGRQLGHVVVSEDIDHGRAAGAVMVYVADLDNATSALQAGLLLAKTRSKQLLVLQVIEQPADEPDGDHQPEARAAWLSLQDLVDTLASEEVTIVPLVRLAPTIIDGITSTIWDEQVVTTVLAWPRTNEESPGLSAEDVDHIVTHAPCQIAVVHGDLPETIRLVVVPMTSTAHNQSAIVFGREMVSRAGGQVKALGVVRGKASADAMDKARFYIRSAVNDLDDPGGIETDVIQLNAPDDLNQAIKEFDVTIMGASEEGFLTPTSFAGFPSEKVGNAPRPGIVVKKKERSGAFWLRQAWESLYRILPKVDQAEQVVIYRSMNKNARANVDFYVLMLFAAGIALLGLMLNSSSVIIGAMLIAPLMSPILSMSHGVIMGNLQMLRAAARSTLNGVILAIAVSAFFSLMLFAFVGVLKPTDEILARTSPNLLDLLVALISGAAAAYAVCRSQLAAALPGVAIAAALVPPLCVTGYGLGTGQFDIAAGSGLLFLTNLAAIIVAGAATFLLLGFRPPVRIERGEQARLGLTIALIALIVVSAILFVITLTSSSRASDTAIIESMLTSALPPDQAEVVNIEVESQRFDYLVDFTVLDYTGAVTLDDYNALAGEVSRAIGNDIILRGRIVDAKLAVASSGSDNYFYIPPTVTPTPSPTFTPTLTLAPSPTSIPSPTPTLTPTFTSTPEQTATATMTFTLELTPTLEPTDTPAPTITPEPTQTPTLEPTVIPTLEPTQTSTLEPSATPTPGDGT